MKNMATLTTIMSRHWEASKRKPTPGKVLTKTWKQCATGRPLLKAPRFKTAKFNIKTR